MFLIMFMLFIAKFVSLGKRLCRIEPPDLSVNFSRSLSRDVLLVVTEPAENETVVMVMFDGGLDLDVQDPDLADHEGGETLLLQYCASDVSYHVEECGRDLGSRQSFGQLFFQRSFMPSDLGIALGTPIA